MRILYTGILLLVVFLTSCSKIEDVMFDGEGSHNAYLATLTVGDSVLVPTFSTNVTNYVIQAYVSNSSTVVGMPADPKATVMYIPPLSEGSNRMIVRVTAEDGITRKDYAIRFYRMGADYTSPTIGTLKYVPGGTFQRDAGETNLSYVSPCRMARTEVTRAQYSNVMAADPANTGYSSGTSDPVQRVNWYHAIAFCNKLSIAEGLEPVYTVSGIDFTNLAHASIPVSSDATWNAATANWSATGYRLPTEMEWMWAAMGANMGGDPFAVNISGKDKAFAGSTGGNVIGDYAWYSVNSSSKTHPAGSKLPNELGLSDMSGNVWEWCWDWYGSYPAGYQGDYRGAASGTNRVLRGGSGSSVASSCAVGYRGSGSVPNGQVSGIGFRVVRP